MKVGLSLSRCIKDIVQGQVDQDDVMIIITRTNFDFTMSESYKAAYEGYSSYAGDPWAGLDQDKVIDTLISMYEDGKIFQPRAYGTFPAPVHTNRHWMELVGVWNDEHDTPAVKEAWEHYQNMITLCQ